MNRSPSAPTPQAAFRLRPWPRRSVPGSCRRAGRGGPRRRQGRHRSACPIAPWPSQWPVSSCLGYGPSSLKSPSDMDRKVDDANPTQGRTAIWFLTDFTPLTLRAMLSAVLFSVAFLAKPDSMTVPLSVSTPMLDASTSLLPTEAFLTAL